MLFFGIISIQFCGQISEQPPQRIHSVPRFSLPSKIVFSQHLKQRLASVTAFSSLKENSICEIPTRLSIGRVGIGWRGIFVYPLMG